ncbi:PilZ domain-containing protein [Rhizorhapis suberifaciens]|uniref:PilZ domain-containing protein n=1 Tax=Rhizorhapis suberifaciens TaxID=13656 RepID=A0A840HU57_9SPHN|nr:PilZ domain-containing protein [Rhizorhapis suberifaciens]MBB4641231.1 hypothetical protein [Rhizorhapis suberifaciens]
MRDDAEYADLSNLFLFEEPARQPTPPPDARLLTLFRVGKLTTDRFEELCLIRNAGRGGVMANVHLPLLPRQRVRIELGSDRQFWGAILWIKQGSAGIGFDYPVDLDEILGRGDLRDSNRRSAGPRLKIDCSAKLRVGSRYYGVRVHDLGQTGIGISFPGALKAGQGVVVTLEGFRPIEGSAVWCRGGSAGIAFNQPIAFGDLTHWLVHMFGKPCVATHRGGR